MSYCRRRLFLLAQNLTKHYQFVCGTHSWLSSSSTPTSTVQIGKNASAFMPTLPQKTEPEIPSVQSEIASAANTQEACKVVKANLDIMTREEIVLSLHRIYFLHKNKLSDMTKEDVKKNPEFLGLCEKLLKHLRALEVESVVQMLKIIVYFEVPVKSVIAQHILKLIINSVNRLSFPAIRLLVFLLNEQPQDRQADALKKALPLVLENNIRTAVDLANPKEVVRALAIVSGNKLSDDCAEILMDALLEIVNTKRIDVALAITTISSLEFYVNFPQFHPLLDSCIDIISGNQQEWTTKRCYTTIISLVRTTRKSQWEPHSDFLNQISLYLTSCHCSLKEGISFLNLCNLNRWAAFCMVDYLTQEMIKNDTQMSSIGYIDFTVLVQALELINCRGHEKWNLIENAVSKRSLSLDYTIEKHYNCLCLASFLAGLKIFPQPLSEKLFDLDYVTTLSSDSQEAFMVVQHHALVSAWDPNFKTPCLPETFIKETLVAERNRRLEYQNKIEPKSALEYGLGAPNYVQAFCGTKTGIMCDLVVVMRKGPYPVPITTTNDNGEIHFVEDIFIPPGCRLIVISCHGKSCYPKNSFKIRGNFELHLRTLEDAGYAVIELNLLRWKDMLDREKIPFLMRLVYEKCDELQLGRDSI